MKSSLLGTVCALVFTFITGCSSTQYSWVGDARPPVYEDEVVFYHDEESRWIIPTQLVNAPENFELIAQLESNSKADEASSARRAKHFEKISARLRKEAADLGANGVIIRDLRRDFHSNWNSEIGKYEQYYEIVMEADFIYVERPFFDIHESIQLPKI